MGIFLFTYGSMYITQFLHRLQFLIKEILFLMISHNLDKDYFQMINSH